MGNEKKFLKKALDDFSVREYLQKQVSKAGLSQIIIQKTPLATRITVFVKRPGIVVGKGGNSIKEICAYLTENFGIENPQLDVIEVENPALDAKLMAEKIARQIEVTGNAKQIIRFALREVMEAGAIGSEIRVAGKLVGKGGKAKTIKVRQGYLKKSGDLIRLVRDAQFTAHTKAGAIGVRVKIVPPGVVFPDRVDKNALEGRFAAEKKAIEAANAPVEVKETTAVDAPAEEKK